LAHVYACARTCALRSIRDNPSYPSCAAYVHNRITRCTPHTLGNAYSLLSFRDIASVLRNQFRGSQATFRYGPQGTWSSKDQTRKAEIARGVIRRILPDGEQEPSAATRGALRRDRLNTARRNSSGWTVYPAFHFAGLPAGYASVPDTASFFQIRPRRRDCKGKNGKSHTLDR
jgi:hypothetical protein